MNELFSPMENELLKILGKRRMTISDLSEAYYDGKRLLYCTNVVSGAVLRINKKCKYHKLDWFLNSMGTGRAGKTVWKDQ